MDKERLNHFKELLTERLEGLVAEALKTIGDMSDDEETFPDPTDRAYGTGNGSSSPRSMKP
jgi:DnaK suppressor protein